MQADLLPLVVKKCYVCSFLYKYTMEALLIEELQNHCRKNLRQSTKFETRGNQIRGT